MINNIIKVLEPKFTALPWVGKYGGLARVVPHHSDKGSNGQPVKYPITCNLSNAECWKSGRYKDLIPTSEDTTILYLEQTANDKIMIDTMPKRMFQLNIIIWANLAKLGVTDCSTDLSIDIMNIFHDSQGRAIKHRDPNDLTGLGDALKYIEGGIVDVLSLSNSIDYFRKYNYSNVDQFLMYPYQISILKLNISASLSPFCKSTFTPSTQIECLNLTTL